MPSELDLSQQYGVARMTVRRAVAQLRDKGLVVKSTAAALLSRLAMIRRRDSQTGCPFGPRTGPLG